MFNIFKINNELLIPFPKDFISNYKIVNKSLFVMGKENDIIQTETESIVKVHQIIKEENIETIISIGNISGKTSNREIAPELERMLALSQISRRIVCVRDKKGNFLFIKNKRELEKDWLLWKENQLKELFPNLNEQQRFIKNYEKGMQHLGEKILSSYPYFILTFPIFSLKQYVSEKNIFKCPIIPSKLLAELNIQYYLKPTNIIVNNTDISQFHLKSSILNRNEILSSLQKIYPNNPTMIKQYQFGVYLEGSVNRQTGEIIKSDFSFTEIVHKNYRYDLYINIQKVE